MERVENYKSEDLKKLTIWIRNNAEKWKIICEADNCMLPLKSLIEIIRELKKESFYEIMLVFITLSTYNMAFDRALRETMVEMLIDNWDDDFPDTFTSRFIASMEKYDIDE